MTRLPWSWVVLWVVALVAFILFGVVGPDSLARFVDG